MKAKLIYWLFISNLMTLTYFTHSFEGAMVLFFSFLGIYFPLFKED